MHPSNLWCFTKEAVSTMRRRKLIAFATLSTCFIALLVLAATLVATLNLSLISNKLRSSAEVTVFLRKDASASERNEFEAWLVHVPEAAKHEYVSPEKALAELARQLGHDSRLIEAADGNPIPPSFRIHADAPDQVKPLVTALRARPEVFRVVYASDATARLLTMSRLLNIGGIVMSVLLAVASVTIIHNALAVAIDARRRDIRIMYLVGADPLLIRLPYLVNGALYGVAAALAASVVTVLAYALVAGAVRSAFPFLPTLDAARAGLITVPVTVVFGATVGLLGASLSLGRHLAPRRSAASETREHSRLGVGARVALTVLVLVVVLMSAAVVRADAGLPQQIAQAKRLGSAVTAGTRRLKVLDRQVRAAQTRLHQLGVETARLQRHITAVESEKSGISRRLSGQLLAYYAADQGGEMKVLAGSRNFDDAAVAGQRLRFVLENEYGAFDRARDLLDDLALSKTRLDRARRETASLKRRLSAMRRQVSVSTARRESQLAKLTAEIRGSLAVFGRTSGPVVVYGTDGFIFPVAGHHEYSNDWGNPRSGGRTHKGTDVMAAMGTPLLSVVGGRVEHGSNGLGGTVIKLYADDGTMYYYAHLSGYVAGVNSGDSVAPGQPIGYVGDSGNAKGTPPHLHIEIHPGGGAAVNPYPTLTAADKLLFET